MESYKEKLILEMILKLNEIRTYKLIHTVISILFWSDFVYVLLGYAEYDEYFLLLTLVCLFGNNRVGNKINETEEEYDVLKEEYEKYFEDENV